MADRTAIIIGAGPAGLTAAYELLRRTDVRPIVLEKADMVGGLSRTMNYRGNCIDIGGHRFFSKSDRVMAWWLDMLPLQRLDARDQVHARSMGLGADAAPDPDETDNVMLLRSRRSRIYFLRKFFDYPISLSWRTLRNLGGRRVARLGLSYLRARLRPIRAERNLEQFFINRFGRELYRTFFQSYTEKVWGVPCREISAAWGVQRVKGLSVSAALLHVLKRRFRGRRDLAQKGTQTSLIEQFLYPKHGPGQMWETCAQRVQECGGRILLGAEVTRILAEGRRAVGVEVRNTHTGATAVYRGDYCLSTMALNEFVAGLTCDVPSDVRAISDGLVYRDFITVGLLLNKLKISDQAKTGRGLLADNWIYIQEPDVLLGRLQIFNNWSPYLVADQSKVWLGLEYFCNDTDDLWRRSDSEMAALAIRELVKIGLANQADVLDSTVIRMSKTYPAYFGAYSRFNELRTYLDSFENLFLIGRNGMHRYNNQDHSMLSAMAAVENIAAGRMDKANIWAVNAEQEYHEGR